MTIIMRVGKGADAREYVVVLSGKADESQQLVTRIVAELQSNGGAMDGITLRRVNEL